MRQLLYLCVIALSALTASCAANRVHDHSKDAHIDSLVTSRNFKFSPRNVNSNLTSQYPNLANVSAEGYYLKLQEDTVSMHLPFFGRGYSVMPSDDGLNFKARVKSISERTDRRGNRIVTIEVRSPHANDLFTITINVVGSSAMLYLQSNQREQISYTGEIVPNESE